MNTKKEFGDFQTPERLALKAVALVVRLFGNPDVVVEPTVGLGAFLKAAAEQWRHAVRYEGYEINQEYADATRQSMKDYHAEIYHRDFFAEDWNLNLSKFGTKRVLVIGNPPWVTNSELGQLGSRNLPQKTNFQGLRGFEARTGKSNFDISEWMLIRLLEALPPTGAIAMLCKTTTARKVLRYFWKTGKGREKACLFRIDAMAEFGVSVDACLFFVTGKPTAKRVAIMHSDLNLKSEQITFGFIGGDLVSDINGYQTHRNLDGGEPFYKWRSGVKHDAARVMEFNREGRALVNGFGEIVDIEEDYVFPFLKSSDIGNGRLNIRKSVLVTQRHPDDDTSGIKRKVPKTWDYLMRHAEILDGRRSSIYDNRPRFSVFGIGAYSFAPWKLAVSGLYKRISFVAVPPLNGRPVMVDDTCYSISCQSREEADLLLVLISSMEAQEFLKSLIFSDSKRPITISVLQR